MNVTELITALQPFEKPAETKHKKGDAPAAPYEDLPVWISLTVNGRTERVPLVSVALETGDGQWGVPAHVELKAA